MKLAEMYCGGCGHELFTLSRPRDGEMHYDHGWIATCNHCGSKSLLIISPAHTTIRRPTDFPEFGIEDGPGLLCTKGEA